MSPLAHEALTIALGAFSLLLSLALGLAAWIGRDEIAERKKATEKVAGLETEVAVLKASRVTDRLEGAETRVRKLEESFLELRGDVKVIRQIVEGTKETK